MPESKRERWEGKAVGLLWESQFKMSRVLVHEDSGVGVECLGHSGIE